MRIVNPETPCPLLCPVVRKTEAIVKINKIQKKYDFQRSKSTNKHLGQNIDLYA